jgi:hypothetical protein
LGALLGDLFGECVNNLLGYGGHGDLGRRSDPHRQTAVRDSRSMTVIL